MSGADCHGGEPNAPRLSLKDLLEARDVYHGQLINRANVVGTAVGLSLIRKTDDEDPGTRRVKTPRGPRTFENSEVRATSRPCVLVLVSEWKDAAEFGGGGLDPDQMVPRTLNLADGRAVPVCVVQVPVTAPTGAAPADVRWPDSYLGGGCPIVVDGQGQGLEQRASVGCLVIYGHTSYCLTSRQLTAEVGAPARALVRGNLVPVGRVSAKQLSRRRFGEVFPDLGDRAGLAEAQISEDGSGPSDDRAPAVGQHSEAGATQSGEVAPVAARRSDDGMPPSGGLPPSPVGPSTDVGRRTVLALDIGLIELDNVDDWTSQPFGLAEPVGEMVDLRDPNTALQLIDQEVTAFGAASGLLNGKIKALFYRGADELVSQFLIAPDADSTPTRSGDAGTVWYLRTFPDPATPEATLLRPLAVEWGRQAASGATPQLTLTPTDDSAASVGFTLACGLSTACRLLEVDLVQKHNTGFNPFWGQTGHYSIASVAIEAVTNPDLRALLRANIERISFRLDQLTPEQIRTKLANGDFVELADVPDLVWKKTPQRVPGGRDFAQNSGPEHPNHYADIDEPDAAGGPTLRELTLAPGTLSNMNIAAWNDWYVRNSKTDWNQKGLLPFRVWQLFTLMVECLKAGDGKRFVCAAGVVSHYVGDACQPLHGSYLADGYRERAQPHAATWPGKGVHSTYEDKMVDRFSAELLAAIGPQASAFSGTIGPISSGQEAAFATVQLMDYVARVIPPSELCDEYIRLGAGSSAPAVEGLWKTFGERTGQVMGAGARYLAVIWGAAFAAASHAEFPAAAIDESKLAAIYQRRDFAPSLTLDTIGPAL